MTPRIGSVSSCSGDGSAKGATDTRAPAHRIVAAVAMISAVIGDDETSESELMKLELEDRRSANEFRSLFEKELMFSDWDRSVFGSLISVGRATLAVGRPLDGRFVAGAGLGSVVLQGSVNVTAAVRFAISGDEDKSSDTLLSEAAEKTDSDMAFPE